MINQTLIIGKDDRCLQVVLPVAAFSAMLAKSVVTRGTTATRAGCVRCGLGMKTPFSRRGNIPTTEDDRRPNILQLNTEISPQARSASSSS